MCRIQNGGIMRMKETIPCINCICLASCKAIIKDPLNYSTIRIYKLLNKCSLLESYAYDYSIEDGIQYDTLNQDRANIVIAYLRNNEIQTRI